MMNTREGGRRQHFLLLVVSFTALLVVEPFFQDATSARMAMVVVMSLVPFGLAHAVMHRRRQRILALVLGGGYLVVAWTALITENEVAGLSFLFYAMGFFSYILIIILGYLATVRKMRADTIYAAIAGYLVIGVVFMLMHLAVEALQQDAYSGGTMVTDGTYYSFITLTTLGYGDIAPVSAVAKRVSLLEAVVGVLYTTVAVAMIVGIYITERLRPQE
jgi:hypothetical protein